MKMKREIHALDYAITELVVALDRLFLRRVEWWKKPAGLDVVVEKLIPLIPSCWVKIHPLNWFPDAWIHAEFCCIGPRGWTPINGRIEHPALPPTNGRSFSFIRVPTTVLSWKYELRGYRTCDEELLVELRKEAVLRAGS